MGISNKGYKYARQLFLGEREMHWGERKAT